MPKLKEGEMTKVQLQAAYQGALQEIEDLKARLARKDLDHAAELERLNADLAASQRETAQVRVQLDTSNRSLETTRGDLRALREMSLEQLIGWGFARQVSMETLQDDGREIFQMLAKAFQARRKSKLSAELLGDTAKGEVTTRGSVRTMKLQLGLGSRSMVLTLEEGPRLLLEDDSFGRLYTGALTTELGLSEVRPNRRIFAQSGERGAARFVGIFLTSMMSTPPFPGPHGPITNVAFVNDEIVDLDHLSEAKVSPTVAAMLSMLFDQLVNESKEQKSPKE